MATASDFRIDPVVRSEKLPDRIYEDILNQIRIGRLAEGVRLPAETELAALFKVSRPVVREALSRLRADGVIASRRGSGSWVQRRPSHDFFNLAPAGNIAGLMRCFEFRISIEAEAAALAAERRSARGLARIEAAFAELNKIIAQGKVGVEEDINFHMAIAAATRNPLFEDALSALSPQLTQGITLTRRLSLRASRKRVLLVQSEHKQIVAAIRNEDPEAARAAMRHHISNARARVLDDSAKP